MKIKKTDEEGFEPPTPWSVATCSGPLSYTSLTVMKYSTVFLITQGVLKKFFFRQISIRLKALTYKAFSHQ